MIPAALARWLGALLAGYEPLKVTGSRRDGRIGSAALSVEG